MRLMFIAEKYPPIVGGGETHLEQLACGLVARGHQVTMCTDRTGVAAEPESQGVRIVDVPGLRRACQDLHCYESLPRLFQLLTTESYDAVHVVNYVPALLLTWLRSAVRTPVFMSTFETFIPQERVFGMFHDFRLEDTLRRSVATKLNPDLLFCGSQAYLNWAIAAGFDKRALRLVPFSTDVERFAFAPEVRKRFRTARGWAEEDFVFFVPARPVPRKRIEDVLSALVRLRHRRRIRLMLNVPTGRADHAYLHQLRCQVGRDGLETIVHWEADVAWTEMPTLFNACDAVVLPSAREGFAISLIEAMAASRPVIATDIEGPTEFVSHEVTGLIYPCGDVAQLVERMVRVLEGNTTAMVERALRMTRTSYSLAPMVTSYVQAYQEHCGAAS